MSGIRGYLITGGRVIDPSRRLDKVTDVLIEGDVIRAIGDHVSSLVVTPGIVTIHANGLVVAPGFVDLHVHLREPGTEGETFETGGRAAVAGGFTTVCVMPNTNPAIDNRDRVAWQYERAKSVDLVKIKVVGALTVGRVGKRAADIVDMARGGIVALSDDGSGVQDAGVMMSAMIAAAEHGLPVSDHAEDACLSGNGVVNEGRLSKEWRVPGKPSVSEDAMIARDIEIARATDAHLHVAHLSTERGVELVRRAKNDGIRVTAEVTPHHLALTDESVVRRENLWPQSFEPGVAPTHDRPASDLNPNKKMNPPLRSARDRSALLKGLDEGVIDAVATDHAPHPADKKAKGIVDAPNGVIGLETAFSVVNSINHSCYTLSIARVIELLSSGPAKVFGLEAGTLRPGCKADVVILNQHAQWVVKPEEIHSNSKNTPWAGETLLGRVLYTFVDGKLVFDLLGKGAS